MADLHLQEESFKRAEKARLRNKVEERKLMHKLDRKHGLRDAHEYRIQMMSQERKLIEKELNKIRTEIRKAPAPDNFDIFEEAGNPGETNAAEHLPGRVRGRAMSIHEQSDRFDTSSHPLPTTASFRRPSQAAAAPHPTEDSRRPSLMNTSQKVGGSRRPSLMNTSQKVGGSRRPSMNPGGTTARRSSRVPGNDLSGFSGSRRMSTLPRSHQPHPGSRRTFQAVTLLHFDGAAAQQPSVSDLLQMAMKNAVMYAVKHVDKLNMNTVNDDDINDDDNDNDDDDDDYDYDDDRSDEDNETTSQYQRLIVVTKESDSEDEEDDITADFRSTKTTGTRKSETSRKSLYSEPEDVESISRSHQRPLSRTSTTLTSISQMSGGVFKKTAPREMVTPRKPNTLELPSINKTPSVAKLQRGTTLSFPREPTASRFADVHSVASENCQRYRPKRKTSQIALPDVAPRRVRRRESVLDDGLTSSRSEYPAKSNKNSQGRVLDDDMSRASSDNLVYRESRKR